VWVWMWVVVGAVGGALIGYLAMAIEDNLHYGRRWWKVW
jgi:uncharacterized membrane protein